MNCDRREIKRLARRHVKRHYILLAVLCAVSIFFGTEFTNVVTSAQNWYDTLTGQVTRLDTEGFRDAKTGKDRVINDLIADNLEAGREEAAERMREMQAATDPSSALGRSRGIFAAVVNNVSSGHLHAMLGTALHSIIHSQRAIAVMMILFSMAFYAMVWIFLRNVYRAVLRRAFLETRQYDAYPLGHLLHIKLVRRWNRTAMTLLLQEVYELLWALTAVGWCIKHYSYFLTPFIVAENPDVRPKEAIALSRRMMVGHKWECCKLELSFLGWRILGYVTFGAVDALWSVPYELAAFTEFYAMVRQEAKAKGLAGAELMNDDCLFEAADGAALRESYANVTRIEGVLDEDIVELSPVKRFFVRNFGIWVGSLDEKKVFTRQQGIRQQTRVARLEMDGSAYPERMNPLWDRKAAEITGRVNYLAPCTGWSLVVTFFTFCLVGWLWEVCLHMLTDGEFVNRGALHGPWLPIYGSGVTMIAVLLFRFRRRPVVEAASVMVLCGFVEYMTSYVMELSSGLRWWDYSGYFLNLNGRICGEGLAVFVVGGMAAVYFLVPLIDNAVTRVKPKLLITVCVALLVCFAGDLVYSHYVPNAGPGITDIGQDEVAPAAGAGETA